MPPGVASVCLLLLAGGDALAKGDAMKNDEAVALITSARADLVRRFGVEALDVAVTSVPEYDWSIEKPRIAGSEEELAVDVKALLESGRIVALDDEGRRILRERTSPKDERPEPNGKVVGSTPVLAVDVRLSPGARADAETLAQYLFLLTHWRMSELRLSLNGGQPREFSAHQLRWDLVAYRAFVASRGLRDPERELHLLFGPVLDSVRLVQEGKTLRLEYAGCAGMEPFLALPLAVFGQRQGADRFVITRLRESGKKAAPATFTLAEVRKLEALDRRNPPDCNRLFPAVRPLDLAAFEKLYAGLMETGLYLGHFRRVDLPQEDDEDAVDLDFPQQLRAPDGRPVLRGGFQHQSDPWEEHELLIEYGDRPLAKSKDVRAVIGGEEGFSLLRLRHGGNVYSVSVPGLLTWKPAELRELLRQLVLVESPVALPGPRPSLRLEALSVKLGKKKLSVVVAAGHTHGRKPRLLFGPLQFDPAGPPLPGEVFVLFPLPDWDFDEPATTPHRDPDRPSPRGPRPPGPPTVPAPPAGDVTITLAFESPDLDFSTRRKTPRPVAWEGVTVTAGGRDYPVGEDGRITIVLERFLDLRKAAAAAVERKPLPDGGFVSSLRRPEEQRGMPRLTLSCKEAKLQLALRFAATESP